MKLFANLVASKETAGHYAVALVHAVWGLSLLAAPTPLCPAYAALGGGGALCLALRTAGVGALAAATVAVMLAQMPGTYRAARIGATGLATCAVIALVAAFAPGAGLAAAATATPVSAALCAAGVLTAALTAVFEAAVVAKQLRKVRAKANY